MAGINIIKNVRAFKEIKETFPDGREVVIHETVQKVYTVLVNAPVEKRSKYDTVLRIKNLKHETEAIVDYLDILQSHVINLATVSQNEFKRIQKVLCGFENCCQEFSTAEDENKNPYNLTTVE